MTAAIVSTNALAQLDNAFFPHTDSYPVAAATKIIGGALVMLNAAGFAVNGNPAAAGQYDGVIVGKAAGVGSKGGTAVRSTPETDIDNTAGAAGDKWVRVERGVFLLANSAGVEAVGDESTGKFCYLVDNQTVSRNSDNGKRPIAGLVFGAVTALQSGTIAGVYVQIGAPTYNRQIIHLLAGADLTLFQFGAVKMAAGKVVKSAALADPHFGILQNAPNINEVAEIVTWGPSFLKAGAVNITTSVDVTADANGLGKDAVATNRLLAKSQAAILAGAVGMVYVQPGGII